MYFSFINLKYTAVRKSPGLFNFWKKANATSLKTTMTRKTQQPLGTDIFKICRYLNISCAYFCAWLTHVSI